MHPNLAEIYRKKVAELELALNEPAERTEAAAALRSMIEAILIYPGEKRGEVRAELHGELAALIDLYEQNQGKMPVVDRIQVSMVAEAGLHLYKVSFVFADISLSACQYGR